MSLALVDLSTREVHEFSVEEGGEVTTLQDFIILAEDRLSAAVGDGKCVRVLSAAIGDNPINICDQRRTVHYYLLDGKPWYVRTGVFCSGHADVCVREISGEDDIEAIIKSDLKGESVKNLKLKFARMTCRLVNLIHLIFEQKELEDTRLLSDCKLSSGSVISCLYGGRRLSFGTPYIYITQQDCNQDKDIARSAPTPSWRRATPGMWLEGLCTNRICPAYSKMVVMNQGFTDLNFITDMHSCKCPICYQVITPILCGFNKCSWRSVGQKSGKHKFPQIVKEDWKSVSGTQQCVVCPDRTCWSSFKLTCKKLKTVCFCILCMSDMTCDAVTAQCGHVFHGSCLQKIGNACMHCFGSRTMTTYQNSFN